MSDQQREREKDQQRKRRREKIIADERIKLEKALATLATVVDEAERARLQKEFQRFDKKIRDIKIRLEGITQANDIMEIDDINQVNQPNQPDQNTGTNSSMNVDPPDSVSIVFRSAVIDPDGDGDEVLGSQRYFKMPLKKAQIFRHVRLTIAEKQVSKHVCKHLFVESSQGLEKFDVLEHDDEDWNLGVIQPFIRRMEWSSQRVEGGFLEVWIIPHSTNKNVSFDALKQRLLSQKKK